MHSSCNVFVLLGSNPRLCTFFLFQKAYWKNFLFRFCWVSFIPNSIIYFLLIFESIYSSFINIYIYIYIYFRSFSISSLKSIYVLRMRKHVWEKFNFSEQKLFRNWWWTWPWISSLFRPPFSLFFPEKQYLWNIFMKNKNDNKSFILIFFFYYFSKLLISTEMGFEPTRTDVQRLSRPSP